jgi:hypothetical protein
MVSPLILLREIRELSLAIMGDLSTGSGNKGEAADRSRLRRIVST